MEELVLQRMREEASQQETDAEEPEQEQDVQESEPANADGVSVWK